MVIPTAQSIYEELLDVVHPCNIASLDIYTYNTKYTYGGNGLEI